MHGVNPFIGSALEKSNAKTRRRGMNERPERARDLGGVLSCSEIPHHRRDVEKRKRGEDYAEGGNLDLNLYRFSPVRGDQKILRRKKVYPRWCRERMALAGPRP